MLCAEKSNAAQTGPCCKLTRFKSEKLRNRLLQRSIWPTLAVQVERIQTISQETVSGARVVRMHKKASYFFQEECMSKLLRRDSLVCLLLPAILAICVGSFAQSTRGSLAGNVTDTSGAVIAGAKIVAVGVETGVTNQTV